MIEGANGVGVVGLNELATWVGLTARRIVQLVEEGVMVKHGRGQYPLKQNILAYISHLQGLAQRTVGKSELSEEKLLTARIERRRRELEYAQQEGSLITVESHKEAMAEALDLVRSNIRNLPGAIAPRLVGVDDARDVQAILAPAVDDALRSIVTKANDRVADNTLPREIPGYRQLRTAGIETLDALLDIEDLTSIPGIGPARSERMRRWMDSR